MKISDLELFLVELPLAGEAAAARRLIVHLVTEGEQAGWGEAPCQWRRSELFPRLKLLTSVLVGRSIYESEDWLDLKMHGDAALAAALEMACWDVIGRRAGEPLCHLWGGRYRSHVPLAPRLAVASTEATALEVRELAEQGFFSQVLVTRGALADDLELVHAVSEAVADHVELQLDAQNRYTLDEARQLCRELEETPLKGVIDPIAPRHWDQLASLGRQTNMPLAAAAGITGPEDVLALARTGAVSSVIVAAHRVGGLQRVRKCIAVAEAARLAPSLDCVSALGLSTAALLHLSAATPCLASAHLSTYHLLQNDILTEPLELADGLLTVPEAAGLGVQVDRAKLEQYQAR